MADISFSADSLIKKGSESTGLDSRKLAKNFVGLLIIAAIGLGIYSFVLPFLITLVWGTLELVAGAALLGIVLVLIMSNWRNLGYLTEAIARLFFGWIISWNPFIIQEKQIEQAEEDVDKMLDEKAKIEGKCKELEDKLYKSQESFETAKKAEQIATNNNDSASADDARREQMRCYNYIQNIGPIANDMRFIINFVAEGHQILKRKIKNAKADLNVNKDIFESAQSGSKALARMKRAMVGDAKLNTDAERAQVEVMKRIALSVGEMRTTMELVSDVTREENLKDSAKMALARERLTALNLGTGQAIPINTSNTFNGIKTIEQTRFPI